MSIEPCQTSSPGLVFNTVGVVTVHLRQKLRVCQDRRDVTVANTVKLQIGLFGIDRNDGNAAPRRARQHEVLAGEADARCTVTHVDIEIDLLFQRFFHRGRQAGAKRNLVTLTMGQPLDANLTALRLDRLGCSTIQCDERGIIDTVLHQRFGKLHACARADTIRINRVVDDTESLARAQIGIGRLRLRIIGKCQALLIGIKRRAIILGLFESLGQPVQRLGAGTDRAAQLIGIDGSGSGLARNRVIVGNLRRPLRKFGPESTVIGRNRKSRLVGFDRVRCRLLPCRLQQALQSLALLLRACRKARFQPARFLLQAISHERKTLRCTDIGFSDNLHDLAGNGTGEGIELIEIRFKETPLHLGIVGEGLAGGIADANLAALLNRDILLGSEIEPEIIAIFGGNHLAGRFRRHSLEEK